LPAGLSVTSSQVFKSWYVPRVLRMALAATVIPRILTASCIARLLLMGEGALAAPIVRVVAVAVVVVAVAVQTQFSKLSLQVCCTLVFALGVEKTLSLLAALREVVATM